MQSFFSLLLIFFCSFGLLAQESPASSSLDNSISIGIGYGLPDKNRFFDFKFQHQRERWTLDARIYRHNFSRGGHTKRMDLSDSTILYRRQGFYHQSHKIQLGFGYRILKNVTLGAGLILGGNRVQNRITNEVFLFDSTQNSYQYNQELSLQYEYISPSPAGITPYGRHLAAEMTQIIYGLGLSAEFVTPIHERFDIVFRYAPEWSFYHTVSSRSVYARDNNYDTTLETTLRFNQFASINARFKF